MKFILPSRAAALLLSTLIVTASLPAQQGQSTVLVGRPVDAVVVTVTRLGPYPASVKHSAQPFSLWIINRSDVGEDSFSIVQDATGVTVPSLPILHSTPSRQFDNALMQLPPGSYRLVFQAHPKWAVKIAVSAN